MELNLFESERLTVLNHYDILDTPPDGTFDRITALASRIFNMPIALITLVDHDRIWFKSKYGLEGVEEIGRDPGLCASAILSNDVYLVEDALDDPRCLANPLVCGDFGLRFYAAAPLHTREGYNIGTFCIIDKKQRYLTDQQKVMLEDLAGIVVDQMELRLKARQTAVEREERIASLEDQLKEVSQSLN